ncbi:MAG: ATPase domain-containing protein [Nanoarchaeota archaeon]|nr:ATPase domain-containing protein [Nanoarchaeota archaeon]
MHKKIEEEFHGLAENSLVLAVVNSQNSELANTAIMNYLVNRNDARGNYVAVNKPYHEVTKHLKSNGINPDKIFFIDCVSKDLGKDKEVPNCVYIDSPQHLTDMSIALDELFRMKHGEFVVIDSLNTLAIYNDKDRVVNFLSYLQKKVRTHEIRGVMVALDKGHDSDFLPAISKICDKTIDLSDFKQN